MKVVRTLDGRIHELKLQLEKLEEFRNRACRGGETAFLPEIAAKLRLLLWRSPRGSNQPLLFDLAAELAVPLSMGLNGPPGFQPFAGLPPAGQSLPAEEFLVLPGIIIATSGGPQAVSYIEFIRSWAEQDGGTHVDSAVDEAHHNAQRIPVTFNGQTFPAIQLCGLARTACEWGEMVMLAAAARGTPG